MIYCPRCKTVATKYDPEMFPGLTEGVTHICPKCNYAFQGTKWFGLCQYELVTVLPHDLALMLAQAIRSKGFASRISGVGRLGGRYKVWWIAPETKVE